MVAASESAWPPGEGGWGEKMLPEFWIKVFRRLVILSCLVIAILMGLLVAVPFSWEASVPAGSKPDPASFDIARLSPTELETLAFNVLTALSEKRGLAVTGEYDSARSLWNQPEDDQRLIHLGMKNVRRLLPLARKLTLATLSERLKTTRLSREKRLVAAVQRIVLDPRLGSAAEVWGDDLTVIHVGPDYAANLTSDDEAMLLLGHELTHVAVRTGRLNDFIEKVNEGALTTAGLELDEEQKEELACDFTGAEVLKRYIYLHPTEEMNKERFSRAFGYEPPGERLAHAWQDFCASYNGSPPDDEHLSQAQTLRLLLGLEPEFKALIADDAFSPRLCR